VKLSHSFFLGQFLSENQKMKRTKTHFYALNGRFDQLKVDKQEAKLLLG